MKAAPKRQQGVPAPQARKRSGTMMRVTTVESVDPLIRWGETFLASDRPAMQVLLGPMSSRDQLLRQYISGQEQQYRPGSVDVVVSEFGDDGVLGAFTEVLERLVIPQECRQVGFRVDPPWGQPWELLWSVICVEQVFLDEPFRSMVDQSGYMVSDVFQAIMEARALTMEGKSAPSLVEKIIRWVTGRASTQDISALTNLGLTRNFDLRYQFFDALCFLLVLANQQGVLSRLTLTLEGIEEAIYKRDKALLNDLFILLQAVERWTRLGSFPLGILIGWDGSGTASLKKLHPPLLRMLEKGLSWMG